MANCAKSAAKHIAFLFFGLLFALLLTTYLILTFPIYVYRWLITKVAAPYLQGENIGEAVSATGQPFAAEFLSPEITTSRCNVLARFVFEGNLSHEEVYQAIDTSWIKAKDKQGRLRYPELQQYLVSWMGFMFWKPDAAFHLSNHVKVHTLEERGSDQDSEQFLDQFIENVLNEAYTPKRSPWEMHLVQNYRNSELLPGKLSILVLRIHHSMADGYALLHLLVEQLLEKDLERLGLSMPTAKSEDSALKAIVDHVTFPVRLVHEMGHFLYVTARRSTPYHIPDDKKQWRQFYGRAPPIPIHKFKHVKNTFGVSFASVVNSVLGAALAKTMPTLMSSSGSMPSHLLLANPVPKPNHPKKLRIHVFGVVFEIPLKPDLPALDRLRECEAGVVQVKKSTMPFLSGFLVAILGANLAYLSRYLVRNTIVAAGVSTFPGPAIEIGWKGKRILAIDFSAGGMEGVAGIAFYVLSYAGNIQICATAEKAVLSRAQMDQLLRYACEEIDILYQLANQKDISSCDRKND